MRCACKWGNERVLIRQTFQMISDPRGKEPIRLDLSGSSEIRRMWRNGVLFNLGVKEKEINNLKQLVVCRHHWTLKQLDHFLRRNEKSISINSDAMFSHMHNGTCRGKKTHIQKEQHRHVFNVPNCPMCLIRKYAASSRKEHDSDEKALNYEKHKRNVESEKIIRIGPKKIDNFTFSDC